MRRLQVWIFQDFVRTLAPFDIRPAQYSVLVVIAANPGLSQADVAGTLGIERARLVRLLDGLEKRGLIRRQPSPSDRRSHALVLTREGQRDLKRIKALAAEHEANLTERLGAGKRDALLAALREFSCKSVGWVKRSADPTQVAISAGVGSSLTLDPTYACRSVYPSARCGRDSRASMAASTVSFPPTIA